jgi:hypothetical protein
LGGALLEAEENAVYPNLEAGSRLGNQERREDPKLVLFPIRSCKCTLQTPEDTADVFVARRNLWLTRPDRLDPKHWDSLGHLPQDVGRAGGNVIPVFGEGYNHVLAYPSCVS